MHEREQRRGPAHMIGVRMRQDEQRDVTASVRHVWRHYASACVAAGPFAPRIDHDPPSTGRAHRECVTLPDVEHMKLRRASPHWTERFEREEGQRAQGGQRRTCRVLRYTCDENGRSAE